MACVPCRRERGSRRGRARARGRRARRRRGDGAADRKPAREPATDPGSPHRRPRRRLARGNPRNPLRRAPDHASSRVHPERSARGEAVVSRVQRLLRTMGHAAVVRADSGGGHRLGSRRVAPRPRREDSRREEFRRRVGQDGRARARHLRRRPHRRRGQQRCRYRRPRTVGAAARREGRHEVPDDPRGGGGEGDPLGRRQRRAGHQHEPRRDPGSSRPGARHVFEARSGRGRIRGLERGRRRRCRRKLRPGALQPVEVRELSGGASTRAGRQRDDRHGRRSRRSRTATRSTTTSRHRASGSCRRFHGR